MQREFLRITGVWRVSFNLKVMCTKKASYSENDSGSECVSLRRRQIIAESHKNSFQDV